MSNQDKGTIYCLTTPTGEKYVGKTCQAIGKAIRRFGRDNIKVSVMAKGVKNPKVLDAIESTLVAKLDNLR